MARHEIGESGRLARALPTLCCTYVVQPGERVTIVKRATLQGAAARIVLIRHEETTGLHKVKLSKVWFEGES